MAPAAPAASPARPSLSAPFRTLIAGVGFLSDAYDLFVIGLAKNVLAVQYGQTPSQAAALGTAALAASVVGQLVFGGLADTLGRRVLFVATLCLVIVGALGSATATDGLAGTGVYTQLTAWRCVLGVGVGGEYPLSATVTAESADAPGGGGARGRGRAIASVFAMQGVGNLLASVVLLSLLSLPSSLVPLDMVWRLALAFGALPGLATVYWRLQMEESDAFKSVAATGVEGRGTTRRIHGRRAQRERSAAATAEEAAASGSGSVVSVTVSAPVGRPRRTTDEELELIDEDSARDRAAAPTQGGGDEADGSGDESNYDAEREGLLGGDEDGVGGGHSSMFYNDASIIDTTDLSAAAGGAKSATTGSKLSPPGRGTAHAGWPRQSAHTGPAGAAGVGSASKLRRPSHIQSHQPCAGASCGALWAALRVRAGVVWEHRLTLLGTAGSWMILDVVFYAHGLFSGTVLDRAGLGPGVAYAGPGADGSHEVARAALAREAGGNAVLALLALPGYILAVFTIDRIGRRPLQLYGFAGVGILLAALGFLTGPLLGGGVGGDGEGLPSSSPPPLVNLYTYLALYGAMFFLANWGPNTTTFVVPAEAFPTRAKATCHGLSAASGKIGAALGAAAMAPLLASAAGDPLASLRTAMYACAGVAGFGAAWTWVFTTETMGSEAGV
jgi:hypothetical protein